MLYSKQGTAAASDVYKRQEIRVSKGFNQVFNRINLSLPVGISYEFKHVAVDLRYHLGLTHVYKDQSLYDSSYNKTIMLTLGYGFDL